jgi:hypothetical protein
MLRTNSSWVIKFALTTALFCLQSGASGEQATGNTRVALPTPGASTEAIVVTAPAVAVICRKTRVTGTYLRRSVCKTVTAWSGPGADARGPQAAARYVESDNPFGKRPQQDSEESPDQRSNRQPKNNASSDSSGSAY